jgi:dTDP-4-amino-4,6-dideoxygalactose transaminase
METCELTAAGVRAGDEVILPAYGGARAAEDVRARGAVPVAVDIDPRTFCVDPAAVEKAVTPRTAAVAAVHLFGHPSDMERLTALAGRHGLALLEYGPRTDPSPLDALRRFRHAAYLDRRLTGVVTPPVRPGARHLYTAYVVRVPGNGRPDRDAFRQALRARGVACHVPVRVPVHRMPGTRADVRLPEAERACEETLALPVDAAMSRREVQRMAAACNALGGLLLDPAV